MRPRYLEIEGLHSFKERQEVDFDRLGELGLFGIFGPTGSGKSTVLDAITLALYGYVQRASMGKQGIVNTGSDQVYVSFTFDLQQKRDRRTYRVERLYRRKKDSGSSVEARVARLFEIRDGQSVILADRTSDVTRLVVELVGLNLEDFTRSVVLPQNRFQEFLLSPKSEKRAMLERIFYLDEYGRVLNEKLSRRLSAEREELARLEGALSAVGGVSEEAFLEAESRLMISRELKEKTDGELKKLEEEFEKAKEVWDLVRELAQVDEREQELALKRGEAEAKKKLYQDSLKARGLTEYIDKVKELKGDLEGIQGRLSGHSARLEEIDRKLGEARSDYEKTRSAAEKERPVLLERRARLTAALETEKGVSDLERQLEAAREEYIKIQSRVREADKAIGKNKADMEGLSRAADDLKGKMEALTVDIDYRNAVQTGVRLADEVEKLFSDREKARKQCDDLSELVKNLEEGYSKQVQKRREAEERLSLELKKKEALEKASPPEKNALLLEKEQALQQSTVLEVLKAMGGDIENLKRKKGQLAEQEASLFEELEKERKEAKEAAARLEEAVKEEKSLEALYRKNLAYVVARDLEEGQPCPVCGSTVHPAPCTGHEAGGGQWEERLEEASKRRSQAEKDLRDIESRLAMASQRLESVREQVRQAEKELTAREEAFNETLGKLKAEFRGKDIGETESLIGDALSRTEKKLLEAEEWERSLDLLVKSIEEYRACLSRELIEEKGMESRLKANAEHLKRLREELTRTSGKYEEKRKELNGFLGSLGISGPRLELSRIEEKEKESRRMAEEIDRLQGKLNACTKELTFRMEERQELMGKLAELGNEGKNLRQRKEEAERKLFELTRGKTVAQEIKEVEDRLTLLEREEKDSEDRAKRLEEEYGRVKGEKEALENQKLVLEKSFDQERERLEKLLKEAGFESPEEAEKCVLSKERQEELEREIKEFEQALLNLAARKDILQKRLNGRKISQEEFEKISAQLEAKREEKDRRIEELENAKNVYTSIKKNLELWHQLSKEHKKRSRREELLEHIQKLLKGNSFVEFICEERLKYIAKEATEILGVLTRHRYALELDSSNDFVIRDNAAGGVHRPVTSLSGGETFLTSLSLALALSEQIQLKGQSPLEFFFLDEGFGTLDSSLLDGVIDSLERLSTRERVIGLISHVPELRNRMARRLIVEPPTPDGRGSRVCLEKA